MVKLMQTNLNTSNNIKIKLALIFIIAVVVRLVWVFAIADSVPNALGGAQWEPYPADRQAIGGLVSPDFNQVYDPGAKGILSGEGFIDLEGRPTAYVAPLYSAFVAAHYAVFGLELAPIRITQIILESIVCVFVALIGIMLVGNNIGVLSGFLYVFYPPSFYQSGLVLSEVLFTFLLVTGTTVFIRAITRQTDIKTNLAYYMVTFGVLIGLASLARPNGLTYPLGAAFLLLLFMPDKKTAIKMTVIIGIAMAITISPWVIRNYINFDQFIPIADIVYHTYSDDDGSVQTGMLDWLLKKLDRLITAPGEVLSWALWAPISIWFKTSEGAKDIYVAMVQVPILLLSTYAIVKSWKTDLKTRIPVYLVAVFVLSLVFATKNALARYIIPIMPLLFPYLALSLHSIISKISTSIRTVPK